MRERKRLGKLGHIFDDDEDSDSEDGIQDDSINFEKRKGKVKRISEAAKMVIR